jgi:hypothetical protein
MKENEDIEDIDDMLGPSVCWDIENLGKGKDCVECVAGCSTSSRYDKCRTPYVVSRCTLDDVSECSLLSKSPIHP